MVISCTALAAVMQRQALPLVGHMKGNFASNPVKSKTLDERDLLWQLNRELLEALEELITLSRPHFSDSRQIMALSRAVSVAKRAKATLEIGGQE